MALTIAAGCASTMRLTPPVPPPGPELNADHAAAMLETSRLDTELELDLASLHERLVSAVRRASSDDEAKALSRISLDIARRAQTLLELAAPQLEAVPSDEALILKVTIPFRVDARFRRGPRWFTPSCGCVADDGCEGDKDTTLLATLTLKTPLTFDGFALTPSTTATLEPLPLCELGRGPDFRPLDPSDALKEAFDGLTAQLAKALEDDLRKSGELTNAARAIWDQLDTPIPLGRDDRLLVQRPLAVALGSPTVTDKAISVPLSFALRPIILTGKERPIRNNLPRPTASVEGAGYQLPVVFARTTAELSKELDSLLVGWRFPERGINYVQIGGAKLYGSEGRAIIRLSIVGPVPGKLNLIGDLRIDAESASMHVANLDFDEPSHRLIDLLYHEFEHPDASIERQPWFDREELRQTVEAAAQWSFRDVVYDYETKLEEAEKRPFTDDRKLSLDIDRVEFFEVGLDGEAMKLLLIFGGAISTKDRVAPADEPQDPPKEAPPSDGDQPAAE